MPKIIKLEQLSYFKQKQDTYNDGKFNTIANAGLNANLNTNNKATLVGAINEINSYAKNTQQELENIKKIVFSGSGYSAQADTSIAYTKVVPTGALPVANLDYVGGMSKKVNQLFNIGNASRTINGVAFTINNGIVVMNGTCSASGNYDLLSVNLKASHKYFLTNGCKTMPISNNSYPNIQLYSASPYFATEIFENDTSNAKIVNVSPNVTCNFRIRIQNTQNYNNVQLAPQLVDLTEMYGSGNEPTTAAQFLQDYPEYNNYVAYIEGKINNAVPTSITVIGQNQWDEQWEVGNINQDTGANVENSITIRSKNYIAVVPNMTYYFFNSTNKQHLVYFYDKNKNYIPTNPSPGVEYDGTFVTPSNCCFIRFRMSIFYGTTYNNDICINVSNASVNGTYKPYTTYSVDLQAIVNYIQAQGYDLISVSDTLFNYIDFENKKAIINVASVDLGTLNWEYQSTRGYFSAVVTGIKNCPSYQVGNGLISNNYSSDTFGNMYNQTINKTIAFTNGEGNERVYIRDTSYNDSATFKAAMSGVMLNYPLATPIEIDLSQFIQETTLQVEVAGTITFDNDYNYAVPSSITYLVEE